MTYFQSPYLFEGDKPKIATAQLLFQPINQSSAILGYQSFYI
ncbi:hypothetical protein AM1_C0097 (plasmid) [Acaryochloris marina MBIC11017]|uniref:Uncharacterized protein n=1 Tax=Acaryochloris marina (strain MBIC 11017) TaxID=329726 RepID=A8ZMJ3_ACAM1|nr:hypothetical protein AM1_C0097 [Acaryochloris marina MBIC11017]